MHSLFDRTLRLDMKTERPISISLTCKQGNRARQKRVCLVDQSLQGSQDLGSSGTAFHPHDIMATTTSSHANAAGKSIEGFKAWLKNSILREIDL